MNHLRKQLRLALGLCALALVSCVTSAPPPDAVAGAFAHVHLTFET